MIPNNASSATTIQRTRQNQRTFWSSSGSGSAARARGTLEAGNASPGESGSS